MIRCVACQGEIVSIAGDPLVICGGCFAAQCTGPSLQRVVQLVNAGPERVKEILFVQHPGGEWSARARVDYVREGDVGDGATPELALGALIVKLEAHARRRSS